MRENLWWHMLGPLNFPIQSEANFVRMLEPDFDSESSNQLLIGSSHSKDLTCAARETCRICLCLTLIHTFSILNPQKRKLRNRELLM